MRDLWQSQTTDGVVMTVEEMGRHGRRLEQRIRRRNLREYIAAVVALTWFGFFAWEAPSPTTRVGALLGMAAAVFIANHLRRHGTVRPMPEDLALTGCLQFHRRELERQRDLLRSVWKWGLLPTVPGMVAILGGAALIRPDRWMFPSVTAAGILVFFVILIELNRRAAHKIQRWIDALSNAETA